ncbi:hypothetical protein L2A60_08805 [Acidiphilium iwatense]|uniref:Uncharacterized protein n=2 Tax=Acidiphilium iwatense TaxID=768198 RepID=A0ABS9DVL2_9PROT|nr:hypothetical protein [Acidiphilium iwatense]
MMVASDFLLLRWRVFALGNALRDLTRLGGRRLVGFGIPALVIAFYGFFWVNSMIRHGVASLHVDGEFLFAAGGLACVAMGIGAGRLAVMRDRAAIESPWLAVLPWPASARRRALIVSVASAFLVRSLAMGVALGLVVMSARLAHPVRDAVIGALMFGVGFAGVAVFLMAFERQTKETHEESVGAPSHGVHAALIDAIGRYDQSSPRWAGSWTLGPRLCGVGAVWLATFVVGVPIAFAAHAGDPHATLSPAIAVIGAVAVMVAATRCAPLVSPVLRTTSLGYWRACAAMLRLPALMTTAWFVGVVAISLAGGLLSAQAIVTAALSAAGLCVFYAMAALSIPASPRLALGFYLAALALAADEYSEMQNLVFLILFGILAFLVLRARTIYRAG